MMTLEKMRDLVNQERSHRELWPEIARGLQELKAEYPSDIMFGAALTEAGIKIDPHDRAALIKMAVWEDNIWEDALLNSERRNPRRLLEEVLSWGDDYYSVDHKEVWAAAHTEEQSIVDAKNDDIEAPEAENAEVAPCAPAEIPSCEKMPKAQYNKRAMHNFGGRRAVALHNYFGESGRTVSNVLVAIYTNKRGRDSIRAFVDDICTGAFGASCKYPNGANKTKGTISLALAFNASKCARSLAQSQGIPWALSKASGAPDVDAFFDAYRKLYSQVGDKPASAKDAAVIIKPETKIAAPDLSAFHRATKQTLQKQPLTPAGVEPIQVYGRDMWPWAPEEADYSDVWHCFHFWEDFDKNLKLGQPDPKERGAIYRSKLSMWARGFDPLLGEFLYRVGVAMANNPERSDDTSAAMRLAVAA